MGLSAAPQARIETVQTPFAIDHGLRAILQQQSGPIQIDIVGQGCHHISGGGAQ